MTTEQSDLRQATRRLRWPVRLTLIGLIAERLTHAFWPLWTLVFAGLSAVMLGLHDSLSAETTWVILALYAIIIAGAFLWGLRRLKWPRPGEAIDRVDQSLPGRPISALSDTQAIGARDQASVRVWEAHVARMSRRLSAARAIAPDLRISDRDPYAFRYMAMLALAVALLFGSLARITSVEAALPGGATALATGPSWEGWAEPPSYTGKPSLYLNDLAAAGQLRVPNGTRVTLRLYGKLGAISVAETVSGQPAPEQAPDETKRVFKIAQAGSIAVNGPGGARWDVIVEPDAPPLVQLSAPLERNVSGEMRQAFFARDDYGVVSGTAKITLDRENVDRRYGRVIAPEPREPILLDLPMSITGNKTAFEETLIENLSKHPWAGLAVRMVLSVEDAQGQTGTSADIRMILPGRRFLNPLANAIVEQRSDLLWSRRNGPRVAGLLRAVSYKPEGFITNNTAYLKLRVTLRRLETLLNFNRFDAKARDAIAEDLWNVALSFEEGRLADALERLRRAQDRLSEAMRQGASDKEISELMQQMRQAMQDYIRQLAQENGNGDQGPQTSQNQQEITGAQLDQMLKRIEELMQQGRTAEAQALLEQLRRMMENMQVTQGQQGQGQQGQGQQAMRGLRDTLRNQQGLSDEAFRNLQEHFNPGAQGQPGTQGQGQGQDQSPGQRQGQGPGQSGNQGAGQPGATGQSLADRQQALRDELNRQTGNLPGAGTPEGDAARKALNQAGRAMDDAQRALRGDDLPSALDSQAEALSALRDGMRNLADAMANNNQPGGNQSGDQGFANGRGTQGGRDPLGREAGANGRLGSNENMLQGKDVYRRAEKLLDEIRRRSGQQSRPELERDYLKRLLERF